MYEKQLSDYFRPEKAIIAKIHKLRAQLSNVNKPDINGAALASIPKNLPNDQLLKEIIDLIPSLRCRDFTNLTPFSIARIVAFTLDLIVTGHELSVLAFRLTYMTFARANLWLEYQLAAGILEERLGLNLLHDRNLVSSELLEPSTESLKAAVEWAAVAEVRRAHADPAAGPLLQETIEAVEDQMRKALPALLWEVMGRAATESSSGLRRKNVTGVKIDDPLTPSDLIRSIDEIVRRGVKATRIRTGAPGHGGARTRPTPTWSRADKEKFFRTFVTTKAKDVWESLYRKLKDEDFRPEFVQYLRRLDSTQKLPAALFKEAVSKWQKGYTGDLYPRPAPQDRPKAFALRHVALSLGLRELRVATLEKYLLEGRHYTEEQSKFQDLS